MKRLIMLAPIGGVDFSLRATQLVNAGDDSAEKLLANGLARELRPHEPTEEQLSSEVELPDPKPAEAEAEEPDPNSDQTDQSNPTDQTDQSNPSDQTDQTDLTSAEQADQSQPASDLAPASEPPATAPAPAAATKPATPKTSAPATSAPKFVAPRVQPNATKR